MRGMQNLFVTGKKARGDKFENGSLSVGLNEWTVEVYCPNLYYETLINDGGLFKFARL